VGDHRRRQRKFCILPYNRHKCIVFKPLINRKFALSNRHKSVVFMPSIVCVHTTMNTPVLVRSRKLSIVGLG
jgi:hypothetical protein